MWKRRVNDVLAALTGHELRAVGGSKQVQPARPQQRVQPQKRAAPPRKKPAPAPKKPTSRRKRRPMPQHWDAEAQAIIRRVKPRTMTSRYKLIALVVAARYIVEQRIPGDVVECGVWRGGSMQAAALSLLGAGDTTRELHLFDTFEGMTAPTDRDLRRDGRSAADLMATQDREARVWAVAGLDDVREGMAELDYPQDRIHYHQGPVEETIPEQAPERIALLRLDTDWYESTKHELEHLYDRLSPGGVLILDDFGHWEGAKQATLEFLERTGEPLLLVPAGSGRIAVKPWR